jgi:hypothetical protein
LTNSTSVSEKGRNTALPRNGQLSHGTLRGAGSALAISLSGTRNHRINGLRQDKREIE